jgi:hypothetical protein
VKRDVFQPIIDRVSSRLASWKGKLLNKAGKVCLAKSILSSLPVYAMQALWLPQSICDFMDKSIRNFIWSKNGTARSWHLVPWKVTSQPKNKGGLGIRSARETNIALLGKLVADLLGTPQKFWVTIYTDCYLHGNTILSSQARRGDSYVWRGIIHAKEALKSAFEAQLGDGASSFWFSNWLGVGQLCEKVQYVHISDFALTVADLCRHGFWNLEFLHTSLPQELRMQILRVGIPQLWSGTDTIRWKHKPDGNYTAASAYEWLTDVQGNDARIWKLIWRYFAHEKVHFFLWLLVHNALPTNQKRYVCHLAPSQACTRYGCDIEDTDHILRYCTASRAVWSRYRTIIPYADAPLPFRDWIYAILQDKHTMLPVAI